MDVRIIEASEMEALGVVMSHAFGFDLKPEDVERFHRVFELDRVFGAFDGDRAIGSGGAFTLDLTVPGGSVACGGTTIIAVLPTHRRQGVLTQMMRFHLDEVAGRGEPVAALWASEAPIYGRFGYGVATQFFRTKLERAQVSFPREPMGSGRVRLIEATEAAKVLPPLYDSLRSRTPGFLSRNEVAWGSHFHDPPDRREGGSPKRWVVYEEEGVPLGFANYRQHETWEGGLASNRVAAGAVFAAAAAGEDALWRYLTGIDLVKTIESWNTDPNSILPRIVADSRRVQQTLSDGMWVRILDVPAALSERRYQVPGRVVFEVTDPFRGSAAGTFALEGGPDGATCEPVSEEADLRLDVRELGSAYLGGFTFSQLAGAGLVAGAPEALRLADLMFGWPVQSWCPEVF